MELATQPLSDKTNTVIIVPEMNNGIKYMLLVNPLDSRLQPELVGVWNSPRRDVGDGEPDVPGAGSPRAGSPWLWTSAPVGARTMRILDRRNGGWNSGSAHPRGIGRRVCLCSCSRFFSFSDVRGQKV